jgi:hypothetical protein
VGYQVAGLAAESFTDLRKGREPYRAGMAILQDRQVHDCYPCPVGQLGQGHATVGQEVIEVYLDRVVRVV